MVLSGSDPVIRQGVDSVLAAGHHYFGKTMVRIRPQLELELLMICLAVLQQLLSIFLWQIRGFTKM